MKRATLILGLGNPVRSDDGVGPEVVRRLHETGGVEGADLIDAGTAGLGILDLIAGYERVVIVDAIDAGASPGAVLELDLEDLSAMPSRHAVSSHDAGLVTTLELGRRLDLPIPDEVRIVAVQVSDVSTLSESLTPAVAGAIPEVCQRVRTLAAGTSQQRPARGLPPPKS